MKILITGGAGFAGSGVVKKLLERGHLVTVIDMISPSHSSNLKEVIEHTNLKYIWKAISDIKPKDIEGYEVICAFNAQADEPMAFSSPVHTFYQNTVEYIRLLEMVKDVGCDRFFLPSSRNTYGNPFDRAIKETDKQIPHSIYGASKLSMEAITLAYYYSYQVPIVILRNCCVYGKNMRRDIVIYRWLENLLKGEPIIVEGGEQMRDPTYIDDTINGWILAIESPKEKVVGQVFHMSRGVEYKVKDIAVLCTKLLSGKIIYTGYRPAEKDRQGCFDISKAREILGYSPKIDLEEGLKLTLEWIKNEI